MWTAEGAGLRCHTRSQSSVPCSSTCGSSSGRWPREVVLIPVALIVALTIRYDLLHREWGVARRALLPGLVRALGVTLPIVLVLLGAGAVLGTLHDRRDFLGSLAPLVLWGGAQQWVLQTVVLRETQKATSPASRHHHRGAALRRGAPPEPIPGTRHCRRRARLVSAVRPLPEHHSAGAVPWTRDAGPSLRVHRRHDRAVASGVVSAAALDRPALTLTLSAKAITPAARCTSGLYWPPCEAACCPGAA